MLCSDMELFFKIIKCIMWTRLLYKSRNMLISLAKDLISSFHPNKIHTEKDHIWEHQARDLGS